MQLIATQIEEAGAQLWTKLKGLQQHVDVDTYRLACRILDKYFYPEVHCVLTTITLYSTIMEHVLVLDVNCLV